VYSNAVALFVSNLCHQVNVEVWQSPGKGRLVMAPHHIKSGEQLNQCNFFLVHVLAQCGSHALEQL